jgi:antitoxin component of RelBE/YafQ-DinJ toxin-antitoxin module
MKASIQARLDEETQAALDRLVERHGMNPSEIVRRGIRLVAKEAEAAKPIDIIGLGKYDSGLTDLSTNKKYMAGYGSHSRIKGKRGQIGKGRSSGAGSA